MAKRRTLDADGIWRPKKVKIEYTNEKLTASAGLGPFVDAFVDSPQYEELRKCVPSRGSNASYDPMQFILPLMSGFWHGYDCLDDMEKFEGSADMQHRMEGLPSVRAFGDFLRAFTPDHHELQNEFLAKQALAARRILAPDAPLILDMDSTSHVQSGSKIEGLGVNYKGEICLDSLDSFDELGFAYGFRLREGGTYSSVGAGAEIDRIFRHLRFSDEKYFRADSAYCNEEVLRACLRQGARFTITAHGNMGWESRVNEITNWEAWQYTEEEQKVAEKRKQSLPKAEVGSFLYQPSWNEGLRFQVVVVRTPTEQRSLFDAVGFKHYAVLTNFDLFPEGSRQRVITHHRKRGNSENFIREKKIHLDLKHFPCLSMNANRAYGLIAMIAYNFMRLIARLDEPEKPHFAKKLREKFLYIPGKFVKHARRVFMKIPKRFREEVDLMQSRWAGQLQAALALG